MNYTTIKQQLRSICSQTDLEEIASDYRKFESDGFIDDCKLRRIEKMCIRNITGDDKNIRPTTWFLRIVMESYKLLYEYEKKDHDELRDRIHAVMNNY
jgi:hypothetical protein